MRFILTGFNQDSGCRVFAFEQIAEDHARTACTVSADLALSRSYGIQIQELPLLCLHFLERNGDHSAAQDLIFSEEEMRACASERAAAKADAANRHKTARRHPAADLGAAWRAPRL